MNVITKQADLETAIATLKALELDVPLTFTNYR